MPFVYGIFKSRLWLILAGWGIGFLPAVAAEKKPTAPPAKPAVKTATVPKKPAPAAPNKPAPKIAPAKTSPAAKSAPTKKPSPAPAKKPVAATSTGDKPKPAAKPAETKPASAKPKTASAPLNAKSGQPAPRSTSVKPAAEASKSVKKGPAGKEVAKAPVKPAEKKPAANTTKPKTASGPKAASTAQVKAKPAAAPKPDSAKTPAPPARLSAEEDEKKDAPTIPYGTETAEDAGQPAPPSEATAATAFTGPDTLSASPVLMLLSFGGGMGSAATNGESLPFDSGIPEMSTLLNLAAAPAFEDEPAREIDAAPDAGTASLALLQRTLPTEWPGRIPRAEPVEDEPGPDFAEPEDPGLVETPRAVVHQSAPATKADSRKPSGRVINTASRPTANP